MIIGSPAERSSSEARVALTPESAKQLQKLGHDCIIQKGAGVKAGFSDAAYEEAGVKSCWHRQSAMGRRRCNRKSSGPR